MKKQEQESRGFWKKLFGRFFGKSSEQTDETSHQELEGNTTGTELLNEQELEAKIAALVAETKAKCQAELDAYHEKKRTEAQQQNTGRKRASAKPVNKSSVIAEDALEGDDNYLTAPGRDARFKNHHKHLKNICIKPTRKSTLRLQNHHTAKHFNHKHF